MVRFPVDADEAKDEGAYHAHHTHAHPNRGPVDEHFNFSQLTDGEEDWVEKEDPYPLGDRRDPQRPYRTEVDAVRHHAAKLGHHDRDLDHSFAAGAEGELGQSCKRDLFLRPALLPLIPGCFISHRQGCYRLPLGRVDVPLVQQDEEMEAKTSEPCDDDGANNSSREIGLRGRQPILHAAKGACFLSCTRRGRLSCT